MRSETRPRPAGSAEPVDPNREPARALALSRLATALTAEAPTDRAGPPPTRGADAAPGTVDQNEPPGGAVPWATPDPDGDRPERVPPETVDTAGWADPPWWARIRWAPDRIAGVALVVLVVALGGFSVHRLLSSVPASPPVPELPVATPGETVPADGVTESGAQELSGSSADPAGPAAPAGVAPEEPDVVVVSVVGLVARSGLVTLPPGSRVADALEAAGGVVDGGDRDGLNLAQKVADGEQILVGLAPGPDGPHGPRSGIVGPDSGPAAHPHTGGSPGGGAGPEAGLVDLNVADATALESLPGVGPVTASSILAWRTANGSFTRVDQLTEVDGIGPATLARLRPLVTV